METQTQTIAEQLSEMLGTTMKFTNFDDFQAAIARDPLTVARLAERWIDAYEGDFEYVVKMRDVLVRYNVLTERQLKGVVNCMLAEVRHERQARSHDVGTVEVPDGYYAIQDWSGLRFIRLRTPKRGRWKGMQFMDEVKGGGFVGASRTIPIRDRDERERLLGTLSVSPGMYARNYGLNIGQCGRCNRELTDEESRARGIGPECWKYVRHW